MDRSVDKVKLDDLLLAVRRLIEGAYQGSRGADWIAVQRLDFERLSQEAARWP